MTSSQQHTGHRQRSKWKSAGSLLSDGLGTKFGAGNFLLDWPTTTTTTGGGGGYMVIGPTTSKTKLTPLMVGVCKAIITGTTTS